MKNIEWSSLSFGYMPTDYNVRCYYRNGKWGEVEVSSDEYLKLHMAATCLHYGQEAFEGLKAYRCPDGKVRVFRVEENAKRLQNTSRGIVMPEVPTELFAEMVKKVVRLNQEYIPPYESGASLYIRPLLIGTSAQVGVRPAEEYCFLIFMLLFVMLTVLLHWELVCIRLVVTMLHHLEQIVVHMSKVMHQSSIWMQRRRSMLTSVVQPTSLVSRMILTLLLSQVLSCHL